MAKSMPHRIWDVIIAGKDAIDALNNAEQKRLANLKAKKIAQEKRLANEAARRAENERRRKIQALQKAEQEAKILQKPAIANNV